MTLHGPVTVVSRQIRVTGVLKGAKVIISGGTNEVRDDIASDDGEIFVSLNSSRLVEDANLNGTQLRTMKPVQQQSILSESRRFL